MFVASTTQTMRSSGWRFGTLPVRTSSTICSSNDSAASEYVPGRSIRLCVSLLILSWPTFFSTVTPG